MRARELLLTRLRLTNTVQGGDYSPFTLAPDEIAIVEDSTRGK